jgi:hypothetical protein
MEQGEVQPPYTAVALRPGWEFRSPAGRWEEVTEVDDPCGSYFTKVWTDQSGTFGWLLPSSRKIHAIPPRVSDQPVQVRLVDPGRVGDVQRMSVVLAYANARWPWTEVEELPAVASYRGRGLGWEVAYRPNGADDLVTEQHPDKLHAKRQLLAIMRAYALALGLDIGTEMGRP